MDAARVAGEGDAAHGVRQVPVEAREEAEAVLPGQGPAAARAGSRYVHRARLAAEHVVVLVDGDGVAAFGEFVGDAESGDAAAEDRDVLAGGGGGSGLGGTRREGEGAHRAPGTREEPSAGRSLVSCGHGYGRVERPGTPRQAAIRPPWHPHNHVGGARRLRGRAPDHGRRLPESPNSATSAPCRRRPRSEETGPGATAAGQAGFAGRRSVAPSGHPQAVPLRV